MPNNYKRTVGKRKYRDYSQEELENAIGDIQSKRKTLTEAAEYYGICKATLWRKVKKHNMKKHGGQTLLQKTEEDAITETILFAADWGFPLEKEDIKDLVQNYLQRQGRTIKQWKENRPGDSWYYGFVNREPQLNIRLAENIKRSRASVSPETINEYFDNLAVSLKDIPAANIVNYDETCFSDDPGRKKVVVRRSTKHAERVIDHSKSATSVMFAVSGSGVMLPPYIVYKSEHLWATWTEGGPSGARYNRSKSGWFDQLLFEDWFFKCALPYLSKLPGSKALIGDNLASHISLQVIKECEKHHIRFVLLPPNSTHLTQPLDVCCFRPIKEAWRKIINIWKKKNKGCIRKDMFPKLLNSTIKKLESNNSDNIKSGFKATGLIPLDRNAVLKKIPAQDLRNAGAVAATLKDMFEKARYNTKENKNPKRKKINISAGQSVTAGCVSESPAKIIHQRQNSKDRQPKKKLKSAASTSVELSSDEESNDSDVSEEICEPIEETEEEILTKDTNKTEETKKSDRNEKTEFTITDLKNKDFIVVELCSEKGQKKRYVASIVSVSPVQCSFLKKNSKVENAYIYPHVPDLSDIELNEIVALLPQPAVLKRGGYTFPSDIKKQYSLE